MNAELIGAYNQFERLTNQEPQNRSRTLGAFQALFIDSNLLEDVVLEWQQNYRHCYGKINAQHTKMNHIMDRSWFGLRNSVVQEGVALMKADIPRFEFMADEYTLVAVNDNIHATRDGDPNDWFIIRTNGYSIDFSRVR